MQPLSRPFLKHEKTDWVSVGAQDDESSNDTLAHGNRAWHDDTKTKTKTGVENLCVNQGHENKIFNG